MVPCYVGRLEQYYMSPLQVIYLCQLNPDMHIYIYIQTYCKYIQTYYGICTTHKHKHNTSQHIHLHSSISLCFARSIIVVPVLCVVMCCVYVCVYLKFRRIRHISLSLSFSLSLTCYLYICTYMRICLYTMLTCCFVSSSCLISSPSSIKYQRWFLCKYTLCI